MNLSTTGKGSDCADAQPVVRASSLNRKSKAERAWEVFTHKVIEVSPALSIKEATELMIENHIHHLVVTENKSIKGIVSSIDLLKSCFSKQNEKTCVSEEWHLLKAAQVRNHVMPAKAGIPNRPIGRCFFEPWIPAFAGMTT
jgi:signal-transduction protein with cAMP-binding, CBS, and nucleotidyltransferase domain